MTSTLLLVAPSDLSSYYVTLRAAMGTSDPYVFVALSNIFGDTAELRVRVGVAHTNFHLWIDDAYNEWRSKRRRMKHFLSTNACVQSYEAISSYVIDLLYSIRKRAAIFSKSLSSGGSLA